MAAGPKLYKDLAEGPKLYYNLAEGQKIRGRGRSTRLTVRPLTWRCVVAQKYEVFIKLRVPGFIKVIMTNEFNIH